MPALVIVGACLAVVIVIVIVIVYRGYVKRNKAVQQSRSFSSTNISSSILDQISTKEKLLLQSRVANARSQRELFSIFDHFEILHKLKLPMTMVSAEHVDMKDQIFRDLVREKININDLPVKFDDDSYSHPKKFESLFLEKVEDAITYHVRSKTVRRNLAMHICCHLSRTRAGGDSLFAVKDIFDTPQVDSTSLSNYLLTCFLDSSSSRHHTQIHILPLICTSPMTDGPPSRLPVISTCTSTSICTRKRTAKKT
jgi:hypothetical protein